MKQRYHRPARWASIAVGLPGQPPSPQARLLASHPEVADIPPGVWHTSDHAVPLLIGASPVVTDATHVPSGARFRLLCIPDGPILSVSGEDEQAMALIVKAWGDPTAWAQQQHWRIVPTTAANQMGVAP